MGPYLTKILLETGQPVPHFLQQYQPEGGHLNFDEEEEPEMEEFVAGTGDDVDAWGDGDGDAAGAAAATTAAPVAEPAAATDTWAAEAGTSGAAW